MATKGKQKGGAAGATAEDGATLEDLYTKLDGHIKRNEFKRVVKAADEILAKAPGDQDAFAAKVVALIQQGDTTAAIALIQTKAKLGAPLLLEKAYCLYRNNQLTEARAVLEGAEPSEAVLQLLGQVLYRMGEHSQCIDTYERLLQTAPTVSPEVKTNVVAAYVSGGRASDVPELLTRLKTRPRDSFDLAYNAACASIDRGDLPGAEELLLLAQRVGRETLIEEELPEEEVEDELTPLVVQLAYVQQLQGKVQEAMEGYHGVLKRRPSDAPSAAVASNNLITLRGKKDLFDSLKRFDRLIEKNADGKPQFADALALKLSARQKEALFFNRFLLLLHSNKLDQARELVPVLYEAFPKHDAPALLHAALLMQEKKANKAEELLTEQKEKSKGGSVAAQLVLAQAAALTGNFKKAADVLGAVDSVQHQPGTVATLVALRERSGDVTGAEAVLDAAISWWDSHMGEEDAAEILQTLTREAADFKLRNGRHRSAADTYKRLVRSTTPSVRADAITGLVASTAHFDPEAAEGYEGELPPLPGVQGLDAAGLERTSSAAAPPGATAGKKGKGAGEGEAVGQKRAGADLEGKKKKRKKKVRFPKGYDPANPGPPPDPERWLPRRERASNKKRNKKKEVNVRGAQGVASKDAAFAAAESSAPEPPKVGAAAKPTPPPSAGSKNKKKGKGRK